ncbi:integrase [Dactylosporangium sp. NPDC051485]|uniref:integrase n=1 Tax=Dactylosporangium sp. NPDC051485 TaxID=3154846 RepID=UPI00341D98AA
MPRPRLRRLRIGPREFMWRADIRWTRAGVDWQRAVRVRVWGGGKSGQALQADLISVLPPGPWGAGATDMAHPTPADVRALVEQALASGWRPQLRGGTFLLSGLATRFSLPGFVLAGRPAD